MSRRLLSIDDARRELLAGASGLAQQAQRLSRWRAAVLWLTITLGVAAVLVISDAWLQREEVGLRILALGTLFAVAVFAGYRTLVPAWRFTPTPTQVARWIEQSRPEIGEQLSTAVQLAEIPADEGRFGSAQFRESAIKGWMIQGFHPVWESYLDIGRWWQAVSLLGLLLITLAGFVVMWPTQSRIGIERLVIPWTARPWPREDRLQLRDAPLAVAFGSQTQLEIIDLNPPLPEQVDLLFREASDEASSVSVIPATLVGDVAVANIPPFERAIETRAVGGDDQTMQWHRIDVVQPPQVESFHFSVRTPEYAGGKSTEIVGKRIVVLAGSQIKFSGHLSVPVDELGMKLVSTANEQEESNSGPGEWTIKLAAGFQDFVIDGADGAGGRVQQSTSWQLHVTTADGLHITLPDLWSIDVVADEPPVVMFKEPIMHEVSATAVLPLIGNATDDLGLLSVVARARFGRVVSSEGPGRDSPSAVDAESFEFTLWEASPRTDADSQPSRALTPSAAAADETATKERPIDSTWALGNELGSVSESGLAKLEGQEITVWLEATDTLGQVGRSQLEVFAIQAEQQLLAKLADKQRQLLERIREMAESQHRNWQLATRTAELISNSGTRGQESVDALSSVSQIQSTISRLLSDGRASLRSDIQDIANLYSMNQLTDGQNLLELSQLSREINEISENSMPVAVKAAYESHQQIQQAFKDSTPIGQAQQVTLDESSAAQAVVAEKLQAILNRMSRAEATQQVQRELLSILNDQRQHTVDTQTLQVQELAPESSDQNATQRAELSADQRSLARRLDRTVSGIRDLAKSADGNLTAQLAAASQAADFLVEQQASSLMRRSADEIQARQLSESAGIQEEVVAVLEEALERTGFFPTGGGLAQKATELRESSRAVAELAERQASLAEQMAATSGRPPAAELSRAQSELKLATRQQAEALSRESSNADAARSLEQAADEQSQAESEAGQQNFSAAALKADSAAQRLADVAEELDEQSRQLDNAARQEKIFQLAQSIDDLVDRQLPLVAELAQLAEALKAERTSELEQRMRDVAAAQAEIRRLLDKVRDETTELPAFDWTLEQTAADMLRCVAAAQRFRISPEAWEAASAALRKLTIAQEAIQSSQAEQPTARSGDAAANNGDSEAADPNGRLVPPLASLKLLRGLQADINAQTKAVDTQSQSEPRRSQIAEGLSKQQRALGERLEQLMREIESRGAIPGEPQE